MIHTTINNRFPDVMWQSVSPGGSGETVASSLDNRVQILASWTKLTLYRIHKQNRHDEFRYTCHNCPAPECSRNRYRITPDGACALQKNYCFKSERLNA